MSKATRDDRRVFARAPGISLSHRIVGHARLEQCDVMERVHLQGDGVPQLPEETARVGLLRTRPSAFAGALVLVLQARSCLDA